MSPPPASNENPYQSPQSKGPATHVSKAPNRVIVGAWAGAGLGAMFGSLAAAVGYVLFFGLQLNQWSGQPLGVRFIERLTVWLVAATLLGCLAGLAVGLVAGGISGALARSPAWARAANFAVMIIGGVLAGAWAGSLVGHRLSWLLGTALGAAAAWVSARRLQRLLRQLIR